MSNLQYIYFAFSKAHFNHVHMCNIPSFSGTNIWCINKFSKIDSRLQEGETCMSKKFQIEFVYLVDCTCAHIFMFYFYTFSKRTFQQVFQNFQQLQRRREYHDGSNYPHLISALSLSSIISVSNWQGDVFYLLQLTTVVLYWDCTNNVCVA